MSNTEQEAEGMSASPAAEGEDTARREPPQPDGEEVRAHPVLAPLAWVVSLLLGAAFWFYLLRLIF